MKHKKWWVLLAVASVLVLFCVVRVFWRPAASGAAHRIEFDPGRTQTADKVLDARYQRALASLDADNAKAADAATLKQLEATKEAQLQQQRADREARLQQQVAQEAQLTPPETPGRSSENPALSIEAIVRTEDGFQAVIGDRVVREGDVVNGHRVLRIRADRVEFAKDGPVRIQKID